MKSLLNSSTLTVTMLAILLSSCAERSAVEEARVKAKENVPLREDGWRAQMERQLDPVDRYSNMSRDDYKNIRFSSEVRKKSGTADLPKISALLAPVEEPQLENDKIVSLSVSEDVPLKEVLIELARRAEVDVEIDPGITGGVLFIAKEKPFSVVIKRLADLAGLRYAFKDGVLKVERDSPYLVNYKFNIIDQSRASEGSVNTSFTLGGSASGGGSSGGGGGGGGGGGSSGGGGGGSGGGGGGGTSITGGSTATLNIKSGEGDIWNSVQAGVTNVLATHGGAAPAAASAAPADGGAAPAAAGGVSESGVGVSVNRMAGVVSVIAPEKAQRQVKEYLDSLHMSLTSQVLIEAKVLEVSLRDEYSTGINWSTLGNDAVTKASFSPSSSTFLPGNTGNFSIGVVADTLFSNNGLAASVSLLEKFGVARSLSNPRISTLNNQFAILSFAENRVYYDVQIDNEQTTGGSTTTSQRSIETTLNTIPIGVVLGLQPSIDLKKNEILMNIRPTLTREKGIAENVGLRLAGAEVGLTQSEIQNLNSGVPIVEVRELDTVLRVKSGQVMVIGGLLEDRSDNVDTGVPYAARVPVFGNLFKSVEKKTRVVETVIFLKATIVPGQGVSVEDKNLYNKFSADRHPFNF